MKMMETVSSLFQLIQDRQRTSPPDSYTSSLFEAGTARIAQKVGEEAVEVVIAATTQRKDQLIAESADLIYHLLVLLVDGQVSLSEVETELQRRRK